MKYTSIFSPEKKITAAQYISEMVCKNRSNNLNIELPIRFWEAKEWLNYYKVQLRCSYSYLKKYDAETMIKVIRDKNIWSLMARWIDDEFQAEHNKRKNKIMDTIIHERVTDSTGIKNKKKDFGFLNE